MAKKTYQLPQQAVEALFDHVLPGREDRDELAGELNLTTSIAGHRHVRWAEQRAASLTDDIAHRLASGTDLGPDARRALELALQVLRSGRPSTRSRPPRGQ